MDEVSTRDLGAEQALKTLFARSIENLFTQSIVLFLLSHLSRQLFIVTMKVTATLAFALPALTSAFPAMMGASSRAELENALREQLKREAAAEPEPQITDLLTGLGNTVKALGDTVGGLLNSVGNALVVADNKRPEPGYNFQAPGPGDSRGPCPGLNLLANCSYTIDVTLVNHSY